MKRKVLLFFAFFAISLWSFGQATVSCFPDADDYNTGTTDGSSFTEVSLINTMSGGGPAGFARFNLDDIPAGATIQAVEFNLYVEEDSYAYWQIMDLLDDPLDGDASSVYTDATDGTIYASNQSNFPEPGWWTADLGTQAVADLQTKLDDGDGWFGVGVWEYETGGTYEIVCHGWDEDNIPYVNVTYLVPGAPLPPYNPNPVHNALGIDIETDLTWDFGDETLTYDLYFGTDFPPATKVVEDETSGVSGLYDPETLEFTTTYYWQVVAKNDADLETPGPIWTFTTACDAWAVPFTEDFEDVTPPDMPYCWIDYLNTTSTFYTFATINYNGIDNGSCVYMNNSNDATAEMILITPELEDGAAGQYANFWSWGYSSGVIVGTIADPNDPTTFNPVDTVYNTGNYQDYIEHEVFFANYTGTDKYIAFKGLFIYTYSSVYMDDILIGPAPTCPKPSNLYSGSFTTTTCEIGWMENGDATEWEVEYGELGFIPTGEPMVTVSENPATLTDLTAGTNYEYYVRAYCSEDDQSYWVGPMEFLTACEPWDVPITEDFEDVLYPDMPICWLEIENTTSTYAYLNTIDYNGIDGGSCVYFYNSDDAAAELILIAPELIDGAAGMYANFWSWGYSSGVIIGTMSDPSDPSTFNPIDTVYNTGIYQDYIEHEVFLDSYTGTDAYVAFKGLFSFTYSSVYIDNMLIGPAPTCPKPTDPYSGSFTTTTADIGWMESGEATEWDVEYGEFGFDPLGEPTVTVTDNPTTLTGLTPGTSYEVLCKGGL